MWEAWDGRNSLLHSSYLHIGAWFIEGMGGIMPDPAGPGYKRFIIRPGVLRNQPVDWVKAQLESPYGMIRSEWQIQNGTLMLNVAVPPNTTATVYLPTQDPRSIKEGNVYLSRARGVRRVREEKGRCVLEVQSGQYTFEAKL